MKRALVILVVLGGAWAAAPAIMPSTRRSPIRRPVSHTVAIQRGDLLSTIGTTGTIEAEEVVDVGTR